MCIGVCARRSPAGLQYSRDVTSWLLETHVRFGVGVSVDLSKRINELHDLVRTQHTLCILCITGWATGSAECSTQAHAVHRLPAAQAVTGCAPYHCRMGVGTHALCWHGADALDDVPACY